LLAVEEALALVQSQPMAAQHYLDETLAFPEHEVEPEVRALAWMGKAKVQLKLNNLEGARTVLKGALAWAGPREQEQVLAAELLNDEELRRSVDRLLGDHPVAGVVLNRVEAMQAFERMHSEAPAVSEEKPARLEVRVLGGARISLGGVEMRAAKPQLREMFLYLVDHGSVPRDVLGETFWPASPPGKRNANIHMAIHSLRRWVGASVVELDGGSYRLSPLLEVVYDVASFRRARGVALALPRGDPRRYFALTEAVNSYTGDFLPEVSSEWAVERRRDLELQYLEVLSAYGEEALTRDQPQRAVEHIRRGLAIDPYRDDLNAQYMEALGRLGRRSEVVTHYQRYTNLLESDLGLEPPREVRDLYARIIR
jgi:DNA-binding SARP family transcriptional activator